jgi:hypothetical protein
MSHADCGDGQNLNRVFEKCLSLNGFLVGELASK